MKTTSRLWTTGAVSGVVAIALFAFTLGYIVAINPAPAPVYSLIAAAIVVFGVFSACACLAAQIIRVLQEDHTAAAELKDLSRRIGGSAPDTVRRLR